MARATLSSRQDSFTEKYRVKFEKRGHVVDANLFTLRFSPPMGHSVVVPDPESDEYRVHRILIDGVVVRYVEGYFEITVTVEGRLDFEKIKILLSHGLETYRNLEGVAYKTILL